MLASQVIDNGYHESKNMIGNIPDLESPHSLGGVTLRYLGKKISEDKKRLQRSFIGMKPGDIITEEQLEYAASDVENLYPIYLEQQKHLEVRGLTKRIKLENQLTPVLVKMEGRGILIDQEKQGQNIKSWNKKLDEIEKELDNEVINLSKTHVTLQGGKFTNPRLKQSIIQLDIFGGEGYVVPNLNVYNVNFASSKQVENLFDRVGCDKPKDDNGKVSFGENPIKTYINSNPESPMCKFLTILLNYREYSKLLSTYGDSFFSLMDKNGRLRSNYGQMWTDTGRLNSAAVIKDELGINQANIPKRADIRSIFIPDPGYSFVDCDQSGQEILIAGSFSKEPLILKSIKEGLDLHSLLGSISYSVIFNRPVQIKNTADIIDIDGFEYKLKELRQEHKSALFALFYGGGAMRIQNVLNQYLVNHLPPHQRLTKSTEISYALKNKLNTLTKYLKGTVEFCKKNGYVVANKLGLRRYFDDPDKAYGEIMNFGIQATGGDSIKIALIKIDKFLTDKAKELGIYEDSLGWISTSVYDQTLCCINDKYLEYAPDIQKIMAESLTYFLDDLEGSSDMQIKKQWSK